SLFDPSRRRNTWKKLPGGASGGIGNASLASFLKMAGFVDVIFNPPPKVPPGTSGRSGNRSGPNDAILKVTPWQMAPAGIRTPTPPAPVPAPPPGPTATEPSAAANWLRVKVEVAPLGSLAVTCKTSLIVPGKSPDNDPSLSAVRERTTAFD